jgi:hypothetical protein
MTGIKFGAHHNQPLELILEDNPQAESEQFAVSFMRKQRKRPAKKGSQRDT